MKAVSLALMTTFLFFVLDGDTHLSNKPSNNAYAQTVSCQKLSIAAVTARGNSHSAGNVLDNNLNTVWMGRGNGVWIQADLGSNMNICDVNIAWFLGMMVKFNFIISVSPDGSTFTNVFTGKSSGTTLSFEKYTLPASTTGRYVRISVNGNNMNNIAAITELSIDGSSNSAPPPPPTPKPTANNENIQTNSGAPVQITLTGTDPIAGDQLTFTVVTPPKNGMITPGTVSSIVYYAPNTGFSGTDSFTYKATDGQGVDSNIATVTITVNAAGPGCTTGWTITGYYIPYEGDFASPTENIPVTYGPVQGTFSLRTAFVNQIETEATGKTTLGWYLTTFDGGATFGSEYQPILQSTGRPPVVGETVAADLSVVPAGTALTIPSLYAPWNSYKYIVEDTGGFTGKHIDIFTGVGAAAGNQTLHLSPVDDNTVCR